VSDRTMEPLERLGIEPDDVEAALASHQTIPLRWYFDPAVYEFELERIFRRSWHLGAPLHKLDRAGDQVVVRVADAPVVVARDLDGELRAFVNVCRHRGHPVAIEDCNRKTFQCRYHAWTYELDGRLRQAPRADREPGFDRSVLSLIPAAVDEWGGFAWINLNPEAPPLREAHPALDVLARERRLDVSDYQYFNRYSTPIQANWKAWVENAEECYHCPAIHQETFSDAWTVTKESYEFVIDGQVFGNFTRPNPAARRYTYANDGYRELYVFPASFFVVDEFVKFAGAVTPAGPESCELVSYVFVSPEADPNLLAEWMEMYTRTIEEDLEALRRQHEALRSGLMLHGRLMPDSEFAIKEFHRVLWAAFKEAAVSTDTQRKSTAEPRSTAIVDPETER
jgi:phenylpropionate dioxygenase-like ring-hydroxylating dioxygenase large terminal subunit